MRALKLFNILLPATVPAGLRIKSGLIISLIVVFSNAVFSQKISLNEFIPDGYSVLDTSRGDLNKDGFDDLVLILKNNSEADYTDTLRPLLILQGQKNGRFKLVERNDNIVLCLGCGGVFGDPYTGITIKNNYFSIEHYGGSSWRWTRIITFKYNLTSKEYILYKDAGESYHTSDPDKTENQTYNKKLWGKKKLKDYIVE